jgi:recombination protein RecA
MNEETKSIKDTVKSLNNKYGIGTIAKTVDFERAEVNFIPTNSYALDFIFGGGLPSGRIIECFGIESSGKSTLALYLIAQLQKLKKKTVLIDAEFAYSQSHAKNIGVDVNELIVSQPVDGESAFDIIENMIKTKEVSLIVVDSVAALLPSAEMEKEVKDVTIALQARLLSKGLRRITGIAAMSGTTIFFVNQQRDKVGVFYGSKTTTSGGRALKFYSSVRLEVKKGKKILEKGSEEVIGNWLNICAVKNKVSAPFKFASMELIFTKGIDKQGDLLDFAEKHKVVKKEGNTYMFGEEKIGVSRDKAKEKLTEDKELFSKIKKDLDAELKTT